MTALPLHLSPVTPAMQAREGVRARAVAVAAPLGACNGAALAPATSNGAKDVLRLPCLIATAPAHSVVDVHCPVSRTLLPSKTDVPGSTPQAISTAGTPAAQIVGLAVPWSSFPPLLPATIAVVVVPVSGVCGQCHHPGKPMQAGRVVDQVNPAHTHQVHQGAPCNDKPRGALPQTMCQNIVT